MKRLILLVAVVCFLSGSSSATTHVITNSGFTFDPDTITIPLGDTIIFNLASIHNALEVSEASWNINDNTSNGGFQTPLGGGIVVPDSVRTYYYVCSPHALLGMKGRIFVIPPPPPPTSTVIIRAFADQDGNHATIIDRGPKKWYLKLYRDSLTTLIPVDSVESDQELIISGLSSGQYVAVEGDSSDWSQVDVVQNGTSQGGTTVRQWPFTLPSGVTLTVEFINHASNIVLNNGFTFVPSSVTVNPGDTIRFVLELMHNVVEVDQSTWNSNGNTSNGGFSTAFGGGNVVPDAVQSYYYVCSPHASLGMKGTITVTSSISFDMDVSTGWNLLSVPLVVPGGALSNLFPSAASKAFRYQGGYVSDSLLANGIGYWIKFLTDEIISMSGFPITSDTLTVQQGWNVIGSISYPTATSSITSDPPAIITSQFFGYANGYSTSDTIQPGKAYWVKVNTPGSLYLTSSGTSELGGRIRITPTADRPPVFPRRDN